MGNVTKAPVNHAIAIKVAILRVTHLAKTKVIAIGIDCIDTPIAFFCDQRVKALEFFVVNDP